MGLKREAFMQRLRTGLGRTQSSSAPVTPVPPPVPMALVRCGPAASGPPDPMAKLAQFKQQATAIGMQVTTTASVHVLRDLLGLIGRLGLRSVVLGVGSVPELIGLGDVLRRKGVKVVNWREQPDLDAVFEVDAGITDVHAAIAESGTIVCHADAGHSRSLSLIPPIHIAIVRRSDILSDLMDELIRPRYGQDASLPSSCVFITGPSKTADIEGVLVTGVHGPGTVQVLMVEDV